MNAEPAASAHATWRYNGVHIWGWQGDRPAPAGWLLSGFGGRSGSPLGNGGDLTRIELFVPGTARVVATSARMSPPAALAWIVRQVRQAPPSPSASLIWFGQVGVLAARLIAAGRVLPTLATEHGRNVVRWTPVLDDPLTSTVTELAAAAPPICFDGDRVETTSAIVDRFVDALVRQSLDDAGWWPDVGRSRDPRSRAGHAVIRALAGNPGIAPTGTDSDRQEFDAEIDRLGGVLQRAGLRARDQPVVVVRIRLAAPSDAHDDWELELQLADEIDPGRWCTAADAWDESSLAIDLAGGRIDRLDVLRDALTSGAEAAGTALPALSPWCHDPTPTSIALDIDAVESFLVEGPEVLERLGIGLIGPEQLVRAGVRVRGTARDDGQVGKPAGLGAAALVEWSFAVNDGTSSHGVDEAQLSRLAATGAGLLHVGHRWVRIDPDDLRRAHRRLIRLRSGSSEVGAAGLLGLAALAAGSDTDGDGDGDERVAIEFDADIDWARQLISGLSDECLTETSEPPGFVGTLRHYQRRALSWLQFLAEVGLGGCLADDMGLGKTATTLAHLVTRPGPHLVVCPLSVVHNWQVEAARFTPKMTSIIHHGSGRSRARDSLIPIDDHDLVITTYGLLTRDAATLADIEWSTVVLDEAQAIKNAATRASRAVRAMPARQRIALTGTPIENRLSELWSILDAVNPGLLGPAHAFRTRFAGPIERSKDPVATAKLRTIAEPVLLRRTKADKRLLPDLPDKIEQIAYARLTREQAALYKSVVDQLLDDAAEKSGIQRRGIVLAALTRLKQICNHPAQALADQSRLDGRSGKLTRFDELIDDILLRNDRSLVFTQFREMGDLLERHLRQRFGLVTPFLNGGVSRRRRDRMVDEFQAGAHPLLLVSLRAGGTGLNLTAASNVVHYDRWWNPAVEDQATDRAWRIGQTNTVMVHKLVTEGTVEERIGTIIDDKRALADAVIGSGETWVSELSDDELRRLVELDPGDGA
jgi:superfamily II DNA or RNA helicase